MNLFLDVRMDSQVVDQPAYGYCRRLVPSQEE